MVHFNIILAAFCLTSIVEVFGIQTRNFLVDTDGGSDDVTALFALLKQEDVEILAITCNAVGTSTKTACDNVRELLTKLKKTDIPLVEGPSQNLIGEDKFEGSNGVVSEVANTIVDVILNNQDVIVLGFGSITNLALAELRYPGIFKKTKDVFILGGTAKGRGNVKDKEWIEENMYADPEAAKLLFSMEKEARKIIHVLPYDVCVDEKITLEERIGIVGSHIEYLNEVEAKELKEDEENGGNWTPCDTMLVVVVLDSTLVKELGTADTEVETCGTQSRGAMFIALLFEEAARVDSKIILDFHDEGLKKYLTQLFHKD